MILGEQVLEEIGNGQTHLAAAWLPKGHRLLEIGCSTGYLTGHFLGRAERTVGLDINVRALAAARRRHPDVPAVCSEVERLPFADRSFDAIVMLEVLEHTGSDGAAIAEVRRVLKVGGTLILSTPHTGAFAFLDPHNLRRAFQRRCPRGYAVAARFARFENGQYTENLVRHRHYRLEEVVSLLQPDFALRTVYRGGLLLYPLLGATISVIGRLWGDPRVVRSLHRLLNWDFRRRFGALSYNLMVQAERIR